jgi:TIR domain-containing protein
MTLLTDAEDIELDVPPVPKLFKHHVLFSYAGEDEDYVEAVRRALPKKVDVFDYKKNTIWGRKLAKELERLYTYEAPFCVLFISKDYLASPWTREELAIVSRVEESKPGYMLPFIIDGTTVPEIEGIARLDKTLARTPEELAERLVAKIREPPPKPWWFYVSTEVKVAVAAVLLALILFARPAVDYFRPSRTSILSVSESAQSITAHLVNRGPKSATVVGQRLVFGALPIEDTAMRLDKSESATIAPGRRDLKLIALQVLTRCGADGMRPKKDQIEPLLDQQPVTLIIDIRESDDAPGHSTRRSVTFPAARLKSLVGKWVSGRETPC